MKPKILAVVQRTLRLLGRLALPDLSNSISIAKLRYIQSIYEIQEFPNPDRCIGEFLPAPVRWLSLLQCRMQIHKLRLRPFYHYLIARTKYFDQVFTDAMYGDINWIINIGCGADTRAYRFAGELKERRKKVFECDQQQAITIKQTLANKKWHTEHITYISIDINGDSWPGLESRLAEISSPVLVILEGVSSYITEEAFGRFLNFIATKTSVGSRVAYDYKIEGGANESDNLDRTRRAFRLPANRESIIAYHEALGYKLESMELSSDLSSRLLLNSAPDGACLFDEDCLVELIVART